MSADKVDVLGWLDDRVKMFALIEASTSHSREQKSRDLKKSERVHYAVAELIEETKAAIEAIGDGDAQSARNELKRALDRIGGKS